MYPPFGGVGPYGTYGNLGLYGALIAYGTDVLTQTSPPQSFTEPITVAEMASFLRLPEVMDATMEAELGALIGAARVEAERQQNRDLVVKQWDRYHDYWPSYRIELRSPLKSVDLVQYRDSNGALTTLTPNVDYVVDASKRPAVLAPPYNATWPTFTPWPSSALLIRFTSGMTASDSWWAEHGPMVKLGMKLLVKCWFNRQPLSPSERERIEAMLQTGMIASVK